MKSKDVARNRNKIKDKAQNGSAQIKGVHNHAFVPDRDIAFGILKVSGILLRFGELVQSARTLQSLFRLSADQF